MKLKDLLNENIIKSNFFKNYKIERGTEPIAYLITSPKGNKYQLIRNRKIPEQLGLVEINKSTKKLLKQINRKDTTLDRIKGYATFTDKGGYLEPFMYDSFEE